MQKCIKTNKTCFKTKQIAKQELAFCIMANLNGNDSYQQVRYYKCNYCKTYHLTSKI
jgi:hypothetical protein